MCQTERLMLKFEEKENDKNSMACEGKAELY